ncbi:MAG: dihydrofolate reductase [Oscillospiraceae bacterium]|jgi:dihydrofolate reductase|nr:dihydrofolate reductase [Oscillospiraceae bacterium]
MKCIVAVDGQWAIGWQNQLLFRIPEDLKRFRTITMGNIVLMGRKTFDSLPKKLDGRTHWVLTRATDFRPADIRVFHTAEEAVTAARNTVQDVFLIGGASVYAQCVNACDEIFVTKIEAVAQNADAYFCNLDVSRDWVAIEQGETQISRNGLRYAFWVYRKKSGV